MADELKLVITGMGAVSPLGHDVKATWEGLVEGKSGVATVTLFDPFFPKPSRVRIAGEVKGWDIAKALPYDGKLLTNQKYAETWMSRKSHFDVASAWQAIEDAGLDTRQYGERGSVFLGNGGGVMGFEEATMDIMGYDKTTGVRITNPDGSIGREERIHGPFITQWLANMGADWVAHLFRIQGPNQTIVTACASGLDAFATARAFLTSEPDIDFAIVISSEAGIGRINTSSFASMHALSTRNDDPEHASRPFSKGRNGFVAAEGANAFVLEKEEFAKKRGAKPLARLRAIKVGSGGGKDERGPSWLTEPNPEYCDHLLEAGLRQAGWDKTSVDVWVAHGTSTPLNDKRETETIKRNFGNHAYNLKVSAPKSMVGHMLGGAGGFGMLVAIKSTLEGKVPPTINYEPDGECDLNYVPNQAVEEEVSHAIVAAFGFGDQNALGFVEAFNDWEV